MEGGEGEGMGERKGRGDAQAGSKVSMSMDR